MGRARGGKQLFDLRVGAGQPIAVEANLANRMQLDAKAGHDLRQPSDLSPFRILLIFSESVPIGHALSLRGTEAPFDETALNGVATTLESCQQFDLLLAQWQDGRRRNARLQMQTGKFHEQRR